MGSGRKCQFTEANRLEPEALADFLQCNRLAPQAQAGETAFIEFAPAEVFELP